MSMSDFPRSSLLYGVRHTATPASASASTTTTSPTFPWSDSRSDLVSAAGLAPYRDMFATAGHNNTTVIHHHHHHPSSPHHLIRFCEEAQEQPPRLCQQFPQGKGRDKETARKRWGCALQHIIIKCCVVLLL